jgi:hypothetical protein
MNRFFESFSTPRDTFHSPSNQYIFSLPFHSTYLFILAAE